MKMELAKAAMFLGVNHVKQEMRTTVKNARMGLWKEQTETVNVKMKMRRSTLKESVKLVMFQVANHVLWEMRTPVLFVEDRCNRKKGNVSVKIRETDPTMKMSVPSVSYKVVYLV